MTVEVVVGVVGRPHGVRGEVAVEPRTDEPDRRFAPGQQLRPRARRAADRGLDAPARRPAAGALRRAGRPDRRRGGTRARLVADVDPDERPTEPGEFYDRQLVGLRGADARRRCGRGGDRGAAPAGPGRARDPDGRRRSGWCPFVAALVPEVDLEGGVLTVADLAGLLAERRGLGRTMRIDVVSIFPELPRAAPAVPGRQGRRRSVWCQLGVHDLRQWTHDRHRTVDDTPYGGGPGMVMRPEPWGEALDAAGHAADPAGAADAVRAHLHPGHRLRAGGRGAPDRWPAAATRASTLGWPRMRRRGCGWTS